MVEARERSQYCALIRGARADVARYTEEAKTIAAVSKDDYALAVFDVDALVERVRQSVEPRIDRVSLSVSVEDAGAVRAHEQIEFVLEELIGNAVRYNDADDPWVSVEVLRPRENPTLVEFRVSDNGPVIPVDEREALAKHREEQLLHGSGLGLWTAKWIVEQSGGTFRRWDRELRGATVAVRLLTAGVAPTEMSRTPLTES